MARGRNKQLASPGPVSEEGLPAAKRAQAAPPASSGSRTSTSTGSRTSSLMMRPRNAAGAHLGQEETSSLPNVQLARARSVDGQRAPSYGPFSRSSLSSPLNAGSSLLPVGATLMGTPLVTALATGLAAADAVMTQYFTDSMSRGVRRAAPPPLSVMSHDDEGDLLSASSSESEPDVVDDDQLATVLADSTLPATSYRAPGTAAPYSSTYQPRLPHSPLFPPGRMASPSSLGMTWEDDQGGPPAAEQEDSGASLTAGAALPPLPLAHTPSRGAQSTHHLDLPLLKGGSVMSFGAISPGNRNNATQLGLVYAHARQSSSLAAMEALSPLRASLMTPNTNSSVELPRDLRVTTVSVSCHTPPPSPVDLFAWPRPSSVAVDVTRRALADMAATALFSDPGPRCSTSPAGAPLLKGRGEANTKRLSVPVSRSRHQPQWRRANGDSPNGASAAQVSTPEGGALYLQDVDQAALHGAIIRDRLDATLSLGEALEGPQTGASGSTTISDARRLLRHHQPGDTELNLSRAMTRQTQVVALVEGLPTLSGVQRLVVSQNELTDVAFETLVAALMSPPCGTIVVLDVRLNRLTSLTVDRLLPLLQAQAAHKALGVGGSGLSLPMRATLTELLLAGNDIGNSGVELLSEALQTESCSLQKLDISRCGFGERGAAALGRAIADNRHMTSLNVGWNNLGLRGSRHLAAGVHDASALSELLMAWTGIGDVGSSNMAKALGSNMTLRTLDLSGCGVSADSCVVLQAALAENSHLQLLVMRDNPLGQMGAKRLLAALQHDARRQLDISGCTFQRINSLCGTFDPSEPDGSYALDLSLAGHRQIGFELLQVAAEQGLSTWSNTTLDDRPFRLVGASKLQIPTKGLLKLQFRCNRHIVQNNVLLTDEKMDRVWTHLVQQSCLASARDSGTPPSLAQAMAMAHAVQAQTAQGPSSPSEGGWVSSAGVCSPPLSPDPGRPAGPGPPQPSPSSSTSRLPQLRMSSIELGSSEEGSVGGSGGPGGGFPAAVSPSAAVLLSPRNTTVLKGVTDEWKLGLLFTIASGNYLECRHLCKILAAFESWGGKVEAVIKAFGALSDPEHLTSLVYPLLEPSQCSAVEQRIGPIQHFTPSNPSGRWNLVLSHQAHYLVARRLLTLFCQQFDAKLSTPPYRLCFVTCELDGRHVETRDPRNIIIPTTGIMSVTFIDLRPMSSTAEHMNEAQFAVLVWLLTHLARLDAERVAPLVDHPAVVAAPNLADAYAAWRQQLSGLYGEALWQVCGQGGLTPPLVQDVKGCTHLMRILAVDHYMECDQLVTVLGLLPDKAEAEKVELCTSWWARCVDRVDHWTDVMRSVSKSCQARLAQRFGVFNIYNPSRPSLHYQLRMFRSDEYQIALQLHDLAVKSEHECISNFTVDGEPKRTIEGGGLWTVMTGAAVSGTTPTVVIEFDFTWPESTSAPALSGYAAKMMAEWFHLQPPVCLAQKVVTPRAVGVRKVIREAASSGVVAMAASGAVASGNVW